MQRPEIIEKLRAHRAELCAAGIVHLRLQPYRGWVDNSLRGRSICSAHGSRAPPPGGQWPSLHQLLQRARQNDVRSQLVVWHQVANGVAIVESGGRTRGIVPKRYSTSTLIDSVSCGPWLATERPACVDAFGSMSKADVTVTSGGASASSACRQLSTSGVLGQLWRNMHPASASLTGRLCRIVAYRCMVHVL
jgi:hypothetical protein